MFTPEKTLPTIAEIKERLPLPSGFALRREKAIAEIKDILDGKDKRKLFFIGPCSADDPDAVVDYAQRLARVAERVKDRIYTVMRVYTAKPRARGEGYMGLVHNPSGAVTDIASGIYAMRKLHLSVAKNSGLFTADEMLYTELYPYADDVVAYMTVGARSAEDQTHRFVASGADIPIGIKNPPGGSPYDHADCIHAARVSSEFPYRGAQVKTSGNPYVHAVLRGGADRHGQTFGNYSFDDVIIACKIFSERGAGGGVIVDCGHANSGKRPDRSAEIAQEVVALCKKSHEYGSIVRGVMIESYIRGGSKSPFSPGYGISVTDPCIGFEETEKIMLRAADIP